MRQKPGKRLRVKWTTDLHIGVNHLCGILAGDICRHGARDRSNTPLRPSGLPPRNGCFRIQPLHGAPLVNQPLQCATDRPPGAYKWHVTRNKREISPGGGASVKVSILFSRTFRGWWWVISGGPIAHHLGRNHQIETHWPIPFGSQIFALFREKETFSTIGSFFKCEAIC